MALTNRREFFKRAFYFSSAGVLAYTLLGRRPAYAEELKLIDMTEKKRTDAQNQACVKAAKPLQYVDDLEADLKSKSPKLKKSDIPGVKGKVWKANQQTCENCGLYNITKANPPIATCEVIRGCLVHPKGSCLVWSAKS